MEPQTQLDEKSACAEIVRSYQAKRFDEAEELARRGIVQFPDSLPLRLQWGLVALQRNDSETALERFEAALERFGPNIELYRWNIVALRKCGRFAAAADLVENALRHFPVSQWLHVEEAWLLSKTNTSAEALGKWAQIRTKFPSNVEAYWAGAHDALRFGFLDQAEQICAEGYARFPNNRHVIWQWARSATRRGDWKEASRRWAVADSMYPNMPEIRADIGEFNLLRRLSETDATSAAPPVSLSASSSEPDLASLMLRFESLGDNCEFGIVQRLAGVEPLSLLRWASISPQQLVAMLENRFDKIGTPGSGALSLSASGEYYFDDDYIGMHTFIHAGQLSESEALQKCLVRLRFLSRKLASDLTEGNKVFIYKWHNGTLANPLVCSIFKALRSYGPAKLLCVHRSDLNGADSRVRVLRDGLYVAAMPELTSDPHGAGSRVAIWHDICREVVRLVDGWES